VLPRLHYVTDNVLEKQKALSFVAQNCGRIAEAGRSCAGDEIVLRVSPLACRRASVAENIRNYKSAVAWSAIRVGAPSLHEVHGTTLKQRLIDSDSAATSWINS
jgi:hypothetical protein